jgi:hypothetical protein
MTVTTPNTPDALERVQAKIERILNENGPFLTLADAARRANIPLPTLSDAARNKRVKSLRLLGKAYVRLSDVEAYLTESKAVPKKQTWAEMVAEVVEIGDEDRVPKNFSTTFRQHLYGE